MDDMIIPDPDMIESGVDTDQNQAEEDNPSAQEKNSDFYALVMGLDYRDEHDALLTDSLMVLHIIPQESIIKLLSIPRDLMVENSNGDRVKINSLFYEGYTLSRQRAEENPSLLTGDTDQLGSMEVDKAVLGGAMATTRNKIEELLAIDIDHMVLVHFSTLTSLVDEVGGIEIVVKRSMRYRETNLYLEPGLQLLDGEEALGYARFRQDDRGTRYYISDFERGNHQQEIVKALATKILSWKNSTKALKLLDIVSNNVKTDINYSDMYSMIKNHYSDFQGSSFVSLPFPEYYSADGDVIIPDEALVHLQEAFHALENVEMEASHKP